MQLWSEYVITSAKTLSRAVLWRMNGARTEAEKKEFDERQHLSLSGRRLCLPADVALVG